MIEENQKKSKEKIELAQRTIQDMISNKERISVPKLMKKANEKLQKALRKQDLNFIKNLQETGKKILTDGYYRSVYFFL